MLLVQKYGGTSVGSLKRIKSVAKRCLERQREGHQVVVVVSAMAGETDRLIAKANDLIVGRDESQKSQANNWVQPERTGNSDYERELSQLISTGEKVSAALVSMAIQHLGGQAISFVGHQLGLKTERRFTDAKITAIDDGNFSRALDAGKIVVCAGFQGTDPEGNITTLGRGGSDTSAVAVAAALKADACEILTDVDGVYTTDPRIEPSASKLDRLTYEEMLELSGVGAKILHIRSVAFAMKFNVPLHVRSSLNNNEGTWIVPEDQNMESVLVTGIALDTNEAKVTLTDCPDEPGTISTIFRALADDDIVIDMIVQNASLEGKTDITFTVPQHQLARALICLNGLELVADSAVNLRTDASICKISIVGVGIRTNSGVASTAFDLLAKENINVVMVSASEIRVSIVIAEEFGKQATQILHHGFGLGCGE